MDSTHPVVSPAPGSVLARFWLRRVIAVQVVLYLVAPVLVWASLLGASIVRRSPPGIVVMATLTGLFLPLAVLGVVWCARPTVLTSDCLLIPRGLRRHRAVALSQVCAVGMVFVRGQQLVGWEPRVWLVDGQSVVIPGQRFGGPMIKRRSLVAPGWRDVADTPAGRVCQTIRSAALACQPQDGPLASDRVPFRTRPGGYPSRAYWSADPTVAVALSPTLG